MKEVFENFKISYEDRNDYLYAFVSGEEDSLDISIKFLTRVMAQCYAMNKSKVLIVEEFYTNISLEDMYTIGVHLGGLSSKYHFKIAFVDKIESHNESNQFAELISWNRGANVKIFETTEKAEAWLLKDL